MKSTRLLVILLCLNFLACKDQGSDSATAIPSGQQASTTLAPLKQPGAHEVPTGRLPRVVQPLHYRLELTLLPEAPGFSGEVEIDLDIQSALDRFYIHGRYLEVHLAELLKADGQRIKASYQQVDDSGVARIDLLEKYSGKGTLHLGYKAPFNQALSAAYTVKSQDNSYVFTQFEAISAREAFPGFDEPSFKVPFDLSVIIKQSHDAIANTPVVSTESLKNDLKRVVFATTRPIPTYLVAFAVGNFDVVETEPLPPTAIRERTVPLRAIAVKGQGTQTRFALAHTRGILEALESYFGIPYPYAKLDLLAVPDFSAGAMENVGAITYRDSIMLVADDANPKTRRRFYRVHAHELAHQWFGDLVTPLWWDDIWLNEAFATWMAYVALDIWRPDDLYRRDLSARGVAVMDADSRIAARRIRQPILSNHDISNAFDGITYSKGGAVLSMFESLLGREIFRTGVQDYLHKHAWGNASADDFVDALAARASGLSPQEVAASFHSFLDQAGLPLLQAELQCEAGNNRIRLSQSRYLPLGSKGSTQQTWKIPVCVKTGTAGTKPADTTKTCVLLTEANQSFALPADTCPDFVMPNVDAAGYYRWSLSGDGWRKLLANSQALSVEEMMSLAESLDGAFNAGTIDVPGYLDIAQRLAVHDNWRIASAPIGQLEFIYDRIATKPQRLQLQQQFSDLYTGTLDRVGLAIPDDNETANMQSSTVNFLALYARMSDLREELDSMAKAYTGFMGIPGTYSDMANSNLVETAMIIAVQNDSQDNQFAQHLQDLALKSDDAVFRDRALYALGHTTHEDKRSELLRLLFSPQLRDNEIYNILWPQLANEATREAAWAWLQQNLDALLERVPDDRKGRFARTGAFFCDSSHREGVNGFFEPRVKQLAGGPRALAGTLESIDLCMAKTAFHKSGLSVFLGE